MELSPAPFFEDVAGGPAGGKAHWLTTSDQKRIRVGHWRPVGRAHGTVMVFPGRTEYIEKYGNTAGEFVNRGFAVLAVAGAVRVLRIGCWKNPRIGHVDHFTDYQHDVQATWTLLTLWIYRNRGTSWGIRWAGRHRFACRHRKRLLCRLRVHGPDVGNFLHSVMKPLSRVTAYWGTALGLGERTPPTTTLESYVLSQPFDGNMLTRDPDMYRMMQDQLICGIPNLHLVPLPTVGCASRWTNVNG